MLGEDSLKSLRFSQVIKYGRFEGKQFELFNSVLDVELFHSLVFILTTSTLKYNGSRLLSSLRVV